MIANGNNIDELKKLADNSVDSVVTDPPYGLSEQRTDHLIECLKAWLDGKVYDARGKGFMGKKWDSWVPGPELWKEVYRVLKPGGHMLVFAGTRTQDLMGIAIRLAGFEPRDCCQWIYGSGFPKGHNISKAIDKLAGHKRKSDYQPNDLNEVYGNKMGGGHTTKEDPAITEEAKKWDGWSTALKPAYEPILLFMKPISEKTIAQNVLKWGVGAMNIDESRISYKSDSDKSSATPQGECTAKSGALAGGSQHNGERSTFDRPELKGRWPANVLLSHSEDCKLVGTKKVKGASGWSKSGSKASENRSMSGDNYDRDPKNDAFTDPEGNEEIEVWDCIPGCPVKMLNEQSGITKSGAMRHEVSGYEGESITTFIRGRSGPSNQHGDSGGASRFFYTAKASKKDRHTCADGKVRPEIENKHCTVKPIALMRYVIKLITPPGGIVLDPFMGSGSTGVAALIDKFDFVGFEQDENSFKTAERRLKCE